MCHQFAVRDGTIPVPPADPVGEVQPVACADPTFTGSGFDLLQVAITGVRTVVSLLCAGTPDSYPPLDGDVTVIALREESGRPIPPIFRAYAIERHSECPYCRSL